MLSSPSPFSNAKALLVFFQALNCFLRLRSFDTADTDKSHIYYKFSQIALKPSLNAIWCQKDVCKFEASNFYLHIRLANFIFKISGSHIMFSVYQTLLFKNKHLLRNIILTIFSIYTTVLPTPGKYDVLLRSLKAIRFHGVTLATFYSKTMIS